MEEAPFVSQPTWTKKVDTKAVHTPYHTLEAAGLSSKWVSKCQKCQDSRQNFQGGSAL